MVLESSPRWQSWRSKRGCIACEAAGRTEGADDALFIDDDGSVFRVPAAQALPRELALLRHWLSTGERWNGVGWF